MRPILRPGTHVLTRGTGELQVGLDPRSALVLPDSAEVRRALALLSVSADRAEHTDPATLDLLEQHDLVLDESALVPALGRTDITAATSAAPDRLYASPVFTTCTCTVASASDSRQPETTSVTWWPSPCPSRLPRWVSARPSTCPEGPRRRTRSPAWRSASSAPTTSR